MSKQSGKPFKEGDSVRNLKFEWKPNFEIKEAGKEEGQQWLKLGGIALEEGTSKNNNVYSIENLKENDGREFKWLFGHPDEPEEHIIGLGGLSLAENRLMHEGRIRNTSSHPDVVEMVKDGFLGPSIHASADKVTRKEGNYHVEGLSIDGIGLVAFQGVKNASIDYAIAESFDKEMTELVESSVIEDVEKIKTGETMAEEVKKEEPPVEETAEEEKVEEVVEEPAPEPETKTESDELKALRKEMDEMKKKLEEKEKSVAVVETEEKPAEFIENNGGLSYTEEMRAQFNKELRERVR